ncbi:MAG: hypothetical protein WD533_00475 [Dehalococcoidia bacterium]
MHEGYNAYAVTLEQDEETGQVVAHVPALFISDYGANTAEALGHLHEMVTFHLTCLEAEGKDIPSEDSEGEGFYLRIRLPRHAA